MTKYKGVSSALKETGRSISELVEEINCFLYENKQIRTIGAPIATTIGSGLFGYGLGGASADQNYDTALFLGFGAIAFLVGLNLYFDLSRIRREKERESLENKVRGRFHYLRY